MRREARKIDEATILKDSNIRPVYVGLGVPTREVKMSTKQMMRYKKKQRARQLKAALRIKAIHEAKQQIVRQTDVLGTKIRPPTENGSSENESDDSLATIRARLLKYDSWMDSTTKENSPSMRRTKRRRSNLSADKCIQRGYDKDINISVSCKVPLRYVKVNYDEFWCTYELFDNSTVADLKIFIHENVGLKPSSQLLKVGSKCFKEIGQLLDKGAVVYVGLGLRGGVKKGNTVDRCSACFNNAVKQCCELNFCSACLLNHNLLAHENDSDDLLFTNVSRKKKRNHSKRQSPGKLYEER
jgi:hypothetical protein